MVLQPQSTAYALTTLTVEPLTWNVIGLDSNNVNVGPNHFPVGVRVCNTGSEAATNVTTTWVWDSNNSYIDIRSGTLYPDINLGTLNAGACADAYYEVEVDRDSNAYDTTREYHIEVNAGNVTGTISTPTPRELYVEHLISQSRNYVRDIKLDGVSIPAGGTMTLMVGQTYDITINGSTATQGYNQLEEFINIPNVIFQVLAVNTVYSAPPPPSVNPPNPTDKLYGDACTWENNPSSPNYRSCVGSDYKNGGDVDITYTVRILQVPGTPFVNPQPLSTLIYDFSGSSYHYNSDYDVSTRYAYIINASIIKSFSPKTINPGGTSTLTFTINNPGPDPITGVHFSDTLPGNVVLTANATTPQCGGTVTGGSGTNLISLTGGTIAGYSTCTVIVTVTASTDGTYNNTSDNLFIDTSIDTGSFATDSLVVSSQPSPPTSCGSPSTMATWTLENYTASTALQNGPFSASSQAGNVTTATGTYGAQSGSSSGIADTTTFPTGWAVPSTTGNSGNSWGIRGAWLSSNPAAGTEATVTTPYFQFQVDANNYGGIGITSNYNLQGNWSNSGNWYVLTSTNGATWSLLNSGAWDKSNAWQTGITGTTTLTGNTTVYFRIYAAGAQYGGNPSVTTGTMYLDGITITGCPRPVVPTLSKSFSPTTIAQGSASTLTFTFGNPNTTALSAISFSDTLPTGLVIDTPNGLSAISCTTGSVVTAPTITATAGTSTIRLTGLQLSASASCSFSVSVEGTTAGAYTNISGNITSTSTGPNTTPTGYGTSSLTVVAPPVINKAFTANPIFTGNTTTLTFSINNPNTAATLTGITFTDTLPAGLTVTNSSSAQCNGTLTVTAPDTISLSGGSLVAGASCSFSVTVTGTTVGLKTNSVQVDSANGGTGNTSTADMLVKNPTPAISLLKSVGPSNSGPWTPTLSITLPGSVYYRFIVENIGDVLLTAVDVTDPNVNIAGCFWVDGDGTALVAPFNLPIADANDNQLAICIIGPITALDGANPNTATADDNNPGLPVQDTSTATYTGFAPNLGLAKTNSATSVTAGGTTNYTLTVTNSGNIASNGTISILDVLPTGLSIPDGAITEGGPNAADWACTAASNVVSCSSSASIAGNGGTSTLSFTVNVDANASGTLVNRARVVGGGDPTNTNPFNPTTVGQCTGTDTPDEGCATDSDTVNPIADLAITKTDSITSVSAGGTTTYTIRVTNNGPSNVTGAILSDPAATGLSKTAVACSATPGQCVTAPTVVQLEGGAFALPALASGEFYEIIVAADVTAISGSVTNTATTTAPAGTTDPTPGNNTASDMDTVNSIADLAITKTDGVASVNAGGTTTYTIRVTNNGPSNVTGAILSDPAVAGLSKTAVACSTTPGQCVTAPTVAQLEGGAFALPALASGQFYEIMVTADVTAISGSVTNTATVAAPAGTTDPDNTNNAASDTDTINEITDLSITKTDGVTSINAGSSTTYTIRITNNGPSRVTGASFIDPAVTGLNKTAVACSATPGQCVTAPTVAVLESGAALPDLAGGEFYEITVTATVTAMSGSVTNTATVATGTSTTDPTPGNNTASDTDTVNPIADLSITKTDGVASINAGGTTTYTIRVTNNGPSSVTGAILSDPAATGLSKTAVACSATPGQCATAPTVAQLESGTFALPALASGQFYEITVTANVTATSGNVTNTATVTPPAGTSDPNQNDNVANDTDTVNPVADLAITKTDGITSVNAGGTTTYTIRVTNNGSSSVTGAILSDPAVAGLSKTGVACSATPGQCVTAPTVVQLEGGAFALPALASGQFYEITVTATVTATSGSVTNTANTTPPAGTTDPTPGNNTASDTDSVNSIADLSITKTDGVTTVNAGGTTTYTIRVTNNGPSNVSLAILSDPAVVGLNKTAVACSATPGQCVAPPTVAQLESGTFVLPDLASGDFYEITVTVNVTATNGTVTNTAATTPPAGTTDPTPGNNSASDTDTINPIADLAITKTDGVSSVNAGGTTSYTIRVTNNGPSIVTGAILSDPVAAGLSKTAVACSATSGECVTPPTVVELENGTFVLPDLINGAFYEITVTADVTVASGGVTNIASTTPPVGTTDPDNTNNSASDTDTVNPIADLSMTKTDGVTSVNVGGTTTYTIRVTNNGPSSVTGAILSDPAVAGLSKTGVACSTTPGQCVTAPTVAQLEGGAFALPALASGEFYEITVTADVTATSGSVTNTATVTPPTGTTDPTPGNNTASDTDTVNPITDLAITKTDGVASVNAGGTTTYTIRVTNNGPSSVTGAVLSDPAATGLSKTAVACSATPGQCVTAPTVAQLESGSFALPALVSGEFYEITVTADVTASSGTVTNTVTVTPPGGTTDPTPGNNTAGDTNTVTPVIDVSLDKQVSNATLNVGSTVTFTLVIANAGPSTATNTVVTDVIPSGYTYVSASITGGDSNNDTDPSTTGLTWTINSLASGASVNLTYQAIVLATGPYDNYAEITSHTESDVDSTPANGSIAEDDDDTQAVVPIAVVDLSLDKQVSNATPNAGNTITFTLVIANAGPSTATNVNVTDVIPNGYTYVAASITGADTNSDANPATTGLTWTINSLASGASLNLTYQATVLATGAYDNYAEITSHTENDVDSAPGNNSTSEDDDDTVTVTPTSTIDISLDKQVNNATPNVGEVITFTLVVTNAGPSTANNMLVTDVVPSGYTYVPASITGGTTNNDANPSTSGLTWTINSLPSGASANLIYQVTVLASGIYDNYAEITSHTEIDVDSTPGNASTTEDDDDTQTVTPVAVIDVSLDKQVSNAAPNVGDTITFTLALSNAGPSVATNIVVTDVVPNGYTYVAASIAGGDTRDDTNPASTGLTWTTNSLAAGASVNLTYQATILASGTYDNYAELTSHTETDVDSTPGDGSTTEDDDDTQTVNPAAVVDLSLAKQVSNASPSIGSTVTFTLTVANAGPSAATNINVTDVIPSGYTYVAASITGGDARNDANPSTTGLTWTINSLANSASVNLTYQATVLSSGPYDNYAEITSHTEPDADSTPGNSSTTEDDDDTQTVNPTVALVADPALSKAGSPSQASVGDTVVFTLTVTNAGNTAATGVVVTDSLPAMFDVTAVAVSGTTLPLVNVTPPIGTGPAPYTVVVTLNSPVGVSDVVTITITTMVNSLGNPPIDNTGSLSTMGSNSNTSNDSDTVAINIQSSGTTPTGSRQPLSGQSTLLPATGFAPEVVTQLPFQPHSMMYAATDVMLEIPSLGVKIPIVGVPKKNGTWDVSWLGRQAGWLEGSAFPSWSGNSLLTSHVYDSSGLPGPFVNLYKLKYGDQIIVHAYGQKYIFEIQSNQVVAPNDTSAFKHEEKPWLTLITCKEYDEKTNSYKKRVLVRAVLVKVLWDK
ncbi:MAG TPA: sortase [Anaerolineales bacterium]|nr:sortase [Anaerolineales bacterium]